MFSLSVTAPYVAPQLSDAWDSTKFSDNESRWESGRNHVSNLMVWWFAKNEWSHPKFSEIADWSLNTIGSVHPSQLSHIRNKKMKMFGLKVLEAFGSVNLAAWAYQKDKELENHGDNRFLKKMGCPPLTPSIEEALENAVVIMHPFTSTPLDQGGFMMAYLGYLKIEGVLSGSALTESSIRHAQKTVGLCLKEMMIVQNKSIFDVQELARKIFANDGQKVQKLINVILGTDAYDSVELQRDITEISMIASSIIQENITPEAFLSKLA